MGWKVRYNRLGEIGKKMPRKIDDGVQDIGNKMVRELKTTLWIDTGRIRRVTREDKARRLHAEVWVGYYRGSGFYSGFQEFGVASRGIPARPIVAPTAHRYEPVYARDMGDKVKEACT